MDRPPFHFDGSFLTQDTPMGDSTDGPHLLDLPMEILVTICEAVPFREAFAIPLTCSTMREVFRQDTRVQRVTRAIEADPRYDYDFGSEPNTVDLIRHRRPEEFEYVVRRRGKTNTFKYFLYWFVEVLGLYDRIPLSDQDPTAAKPVPKKQPLVMEEWCSLSKWYWNLKIVCYGRIYFSARREGSLIADDWEWDDGIFIYDLCFAVKSKQRCTVLENIQRYREWFLYDEEEGETEEALDLRIFPASSCERALKTLARYVIRYGDAEVALFLDHYVRDFIKTLLFVATKEGCMNLLRPLLEQRGVDLYRLDWASRLFPRILSASPAVGIVWFEFLCQHGYRDQIDQWVQSEVENITTDKKKAIGWVRGLAHIRGSSVSWWTNHIKDEAIVSWEYLHLILATFLSHPWMATIDDYNLVIVSALGRLKKTVNTRSIEMKLLKPITTIFRKMLQIGSLLRDGQEVRWGTEEGEVVEHDEMTGSEWVDLLNVCCDVAAMVGSHVLIEKFLRDAIQEGNREYQNILVGKMIEHGILFPDYSWWQDMFHSMGWNRSFRVSPDLFRSFFEARRATSVVGQGTFLTENIADDPLYEAGYRKHPSGDAMWNDQLFHAMITFRLETISGVEKTCDDPSALDWVGSNSVTVAYVLSGYGAVNGIRGWYNSQVGIYVKAKMTQQQSMLLDRRLE